MTEPGRLSERGVFVDTSAFFAVFNANDVQHPGSAATFISLLDARRSLVTTNFVVAETHALLLSKLGHVVARRVLTELYRGEVEIVRVTEQDEAAARGIIAGYVDKSFSYADAMSFAVMERLGIRTAFTFDRHVAQYGFAMLDGS